MLLLSVFYEVVLPILLIAGLGYWFGKRVTIDPRTLSRAAVYLFIPCLVVDSFSKLELEAGDFGRLVGLIGLLLLFTLSLGWALARGLDRYAQSAFLLSVVLTNSGNYGVPLIEFAYGKNGLQF